MGLAGSREAEAGWFGVDPDEDLGDKCGGGGRDKSLVSRVGSVYIL